MFSLIPILNVSDLQQKLSLHCSFKTLGKAVSRKPFAMKDSSTVATKRSM